MNAPSDDLAARTLQVTASAWRATVADYRALVPPPPPDGETPDGELQRCLPAVTETFRRHAPGQAAPHDDSGPRACPACGRLALRPLLARPPSLVYGRCGQCGHGSLLSTDDGRLSSDGAIRRQYAGTEYYQVRDAAGVGYDAYDLEAEYREAKGARLVARLRAAGWSGTTLLEVGSGYGFTRVAAERAGIRTAGVDLNPSACAESERRYGLRSFCGALGDALDAPGSPVGRGSWDAVLYQFVIEHVRDPANELTLAWEALRPRGWLMLLVPSMDAAEIAVFGASYRSFRADHLHLFTRSSLVDILGRARFQLTEMTSGCNIHLFRSFMSERAVHRLYETDRGPDLFVLAEKRP